MAHNVFRISLYFILVLSIALGCSKDHGADNADTAQDEARSGIGREADPVVLTGDDLKLLVGRNPAKLVAFHYQDAWKRVPIQVDERVMADLAEVYGFSRFGTSCVAPQLTVVPCYADTHTLVGPDTDPAIDHDDEVVFMFRDTGKRPATFKEPKGVKAGSGVEVSLSEPGKSSEPRYLYLFSNDGSLEPEDDKKYGKYTFSLNAGSYPDDYRFCDGPNPEDTWFKSAYYERHFTDRWLSDVTKIVAPGASGVDILDEQYMTLPGLEKCYSDSTAVAKLEGAFVTIKDGPVRSIRSFIGAQSATFTQRTHVFYEQREDMIENARVHEIPAGLLDLFDYSKEAVGMKYYDPANAIGLVIDGVEDDFDPAHLSRDEVSYHNAWKLITGPQGSIVMVDKFDTDIADFDFEHFYLDNASESAKPCRGDDAYYGSNGSVLGKLPCTEAFCSSYFESHRSFYYSGPGMTTDGAVAAARNIYTPIILKVTSKGSYQDDTDAGDNSKIKRNADSDGAIDAGVDKSTMCQEVFSLDKNGDGQEDERWVDSADRSGNILKEEWDKDADGVADGRWTINSRDQGRVVIEEWDDGADGTVEARRVNTSECYSVAASFGGLWRCDLVTSETDNNGDGTIDEVWLLEYEQVSSTGGEERRLLAEKWDKDGDGLIDKKWEASWNDTGYGLRALSKVVEDRNADGTPEETLAYTWENEYMPIPKQQWDKNGDGVADEEISYLFNDNGAIPPRFVHVERYRGNVRVAGEYIYYDNDQEPNSLRPSNHAAEWDENGDGIAEIRTNCSYDRWEEEVLPNSISVKSYVKRNEWIRGTDGNVDEIETETLDKISDYLSFYKLAWDRDADGTDDEFCILYSGEPPAHVIVECDTNGDQLVDWQLKRKYAEKCTKQFSDKYDFAITGSASRTIVDAYRPSPGLTKERAYTPQLAPRFERVKGIGTYQPEDNCYDCYW